MKLIDTWMIYGANGYTGKLIAEEAASRGQKPIIAGRNEKQVLAIAEALDLPWRVFDLENDYKLKEELQDIGIVLNCAGPFIYTAPALRKACLATGTHYLDITGEMSILQDSYDCHDEAVKQGTVVISGVGFDVVPTDIIAAVLKERLPTATHLELAFAGESGVSPGTAKTMLLDLPDRGKIRQNNEIVQVPLAYDCKVLPFSDHERHCMSIPWGDLVTAWENTKIPNITIFTAVEESQTKWMKRINPIAGMLGWGPLQRWLLRTIDKKVQGPDQQCRDAGFIKLYGKAWDENQPDSKVEVFMDTPEGYNYTVMATLFFVDVLRAHEVMPGAYTPTQAVPYEKILDMQDVKLEIANLGN